MSEIKIKSLSIYPVKSLGGFDLDRLMFNARGPVHDRHWLVVTKDGQFLTQRQYPKMCLIQTDIAGDQLTLNAPNSEPCLVAPATQNESQVQVWRDEVLAADCGDEAANWLSVFLEKECRLVCLTERSHRLVDQDYASDQQTVGFADGFPILLVSQASLDDFNSNMDEPIPMNRFRPNIVVQGCQPYAEDSWQAVTISGITFSLVKPCSRCIMPSIDQKTGQKQPQVLAALNKHRRRNRKTYFGQNALHDRAGVINVGDDVAVVTV